MLTRSATFFLTLFLGLQAVSLANLFAEQFFLPAEIEVVGADEKLTPAELPKGVRITYDGMFPFNEEVPPSLRFARTRSRTPSFRTGADGKV